MSQAQGQCASYVQLQKNRQGLRGVSGKCGKERLLEAVEGERGQRGRTGEEELSRCLPLSLLLSPTLNISSYILLVLQLLCVCVCAGGELRCEAAACDEARRGGVGWNYPGPTALSPECFPPSK